MSPSETRAAQGEPGGQGTSGVMPKCLLELPMPWDSLGVGFKTAQGNTGARVRSRSPPIGYYYYYSFAAPFGWP